MLSLQTFIHCQTPRLQTQMNPNSSNSTNRLFEDLGEV